MNTQKDNGLALLTIPTRIHSFLNDKVKECVELENKQLPEGGRPLTSADFIRVAVAERVSRVLHEDVSDIPPVIRGRGGSLVAQTAKRLGISQEEFQRRAAELVAGHAFGFKGQQDDLIQQALSGDLNVAGGSGNRTSQPRPPSGTQRATYLTQGSRSARRTG